MTLKDLNTRAKAINNKVIIFYLSITLFLIAIWLLYLLGLSSRDLEQYTIIWHFSKDANFLDVFYNNRYEIGSFFLFWSFAQVFSPGMSFYLMGLVALSAKFYLIKKYFNYPLIAFCVYTLIFVHILDGNQIRAALALTILLYALSLPSCSLFGYLSLAIIATLFHYSGIVILILYFVRAPLLGLTLLVAISFIYEWLILSTDNLTFLRIFLPSSDGQINFTNSLFIMQVCIAIVCLLFWNNLNCQQKKGAYLNFFGIVAYVAFVENALIAHRLRELSQLGILTVLFFGDKKFTYVKIVTAICLGYIILYNLIYIILWRLA